MAKRKTQARTDEEEFGITTMLSEWERLRGIESARTPGRERMVIKVLNEEPDLETALRCLRNYAQYAARRYPNKKWEVGDAFGTFKGKDPDGRLIYDSMRSRINWLLSLDEAPAALDPKHTLQQQVDDFARQLHKSAAEIWTEIVCTQHEIRNPTDVAMIEAEKAYARLRAMGIIVTYAPDSDIPTLSAA